MADLDPTGLLPAAVSELFKIGRNAVEDILMLESNARVIDSDYVADLKPLLQRLVARYASSTRPQEELAMLETCLQFLEHMSTLTSQSRQSPPISPWKRLLLSREIKATKERAQAFHAKATTLSLLLDLEQSIALDDHRQRQQQLVLSTVGIERDVSWASPSSLFGNGGGDTALHDAVGRFIHFGIENLKGWLLRRDGQWMLLSGAGGIGKTFLVQCARSLPEVRDYFEGGTFFVRLDDRDNSQLGVLKRALEELTDKRCLVVLDGMRNRNLVDPYAWRWLEGKPNIKVLVTSTNRNVLQPLHVQYNAQDSGAQLHLRSEDAYKLFCRHAFGSDRAPQPLEPYAKELVKQCGRVPLLLEVTGRSMRLKGEPAQWKLAFRKLSRGIVDDQSATLRVFKRSYDELGSSTQKRRFLALAFLAVEHEAAEVYGFEFEVIRFAWEALGLLGDYHRSWEAKEAIEQISDASLIRNVINVNRLIGNLGRELAKEEKLLFASVHSVKELCSLNWEGLELAKIKIDTVVDFNTASSSLSMFDSLTQASAVKVLQVSAGIRLKHLPVSIGDLKKLKFLDLDQIDELGEALASIGQLSDLIFLRLRCRSVEQQGLDSLGKLVKLKFLHIYSERWPPLVDLHFFKDLHALHRLSLRVLDPDCSIPKAVSWREVSRCCKLRVLQVQMQLCDVNSIQELLFPLKKLGEVRLGRVLDNPWRGFEVSSTLNRVELNGSGMMMDLTYLGQLPHLCFLDLCNFASERLFSADARFPSLTELSIDGFLSLVELHIPDAPQLHWLGIYACPQLKVLKMKFNRLKRLLLNKVTLLDIDGDFAYLKWLRYLPDFATQFPRLCQRGGTLHVDRASGSAA